MAQFKQWFTQDLTESIVVRHCESVMFTGDDNGAVVGVRLFDGGPAYSSGGTVSGAVKRSDGGLVPLTGTLSGNAASVVIPSAALAYPGPIGVHVVLTQGGSTTTVLKAIYSVDDNGGAAVDPGTIIPSINDLITAINTAVASIPSDYSALLHTLAPDFSASTSYVAGYYVWYNGALYRFTSNHAAGSWAGTDAKAVVVGNDLSNLTSAINYYGHPCIKEIYIFDTSYGAAAVNTITDSNGIRFANADGTSVVAAASASVRRYPVVPIIAGGSTKIGYVYVDWTKYSYAVVNYALQDSAFDLQCSPILNAYINKSLFVENAPYIRELYITPGGVTADISTLHIVYVASQHVVRFSNAAGNAFTGTATFDHQNPNHIAPIISNSNTVVGYLLMDWTLVNGDTTVITPIKPIAQSLDYSPSIAAYLDNGVSGLSEQVSLLATDVSTLSGNLAAEQAARQAADTALGARIDNLVSPSGDSVAEIVDARTGANGTVYSTLEARLNAEYGMFNAKLNKIRTIGVGQQYQTVQAAVEAASDGDVLLIFPGVYHESVSFPRKILYLVGTSRDDCVIEYENGNYDYPVIGMVKGILKNLTVHAIAQVSQNPTYGKAYALHCDYQTWGITGGTLYCENVRFINDDYRSVGMGLRANGHNEFVNCEFTTLSGYEALYFHDVNATQYGTENQSLSIKNCTFFSNANSKPTISANTQETASKAASIEWQRNIVVNKGTGGLITMTFFQNRQPIDGNGWMGSSDWVLKETSAINTVSAMNYSN